MLNASLSFWWIELLRTDADFELLFIPEMDGIRNSPVATEMAIAHLNCDDWLTPFNNWAVISPYALE